MAIKDIKRTAIGYEIDFYLVSLFQYQDQVRD